jgi:hypothetical protein
MTIRFFLIPLLVMFVLPLSGFAQNDDEAAIKAVIIQLFDGMRLADSTMVASAFAPNAMLAGIGTQADPNAITHTQAAVFVQNVTRPRADVLDERTGDMEIRVDDRLGTAWVPYSFYIGDNFSHCGVNAIQLAKLDGTWKITYVMDTRRRDNCIIN